MPISPTIAGAIPEVYLAAVELLIKKGLYKNKSDFVCQAVREKIDQYHQDVVTAVAFDRDSEHD